MVTKQQICCSPLISAKQKSIIVNIERKNDSRKLVHDRLNIPYLSHHSYSKTDCPLIAHRSKLNSGYQV